MIEGAFRYEDDEGFEAQGFTFPSGLTVIEWDPDSVPPEVNKIDGYHQSVYESFEDFRTVCTGTVSRGGEE